MFSNGNLQKMMIIAGFCICKPYSPLYFLLTVAIFNKYNLLPGTLGPPPGTCERTHYLRYRSLQNVYKQGDK